MYEPLLLRATNRYRVPPYYPLKVIQKCSVGYCWTKYVMMHTIKFQVYHPGLSSHIYSVIFSANSEIFAFSAMFRAEPVDFNFHISGHNWFSDEHFWTFLVQRWTLLASTKHTKTMKKAKTSVFFSILMLKGQEIENFRITFNGLFWKFLKMWFFRNLYFFWFYVRRLLTRTKKGEKYQNSSCNREKNVTGVNFDVFTVFLGEHVKSLRQ